MWEALDWDETNDLRQPNEENKIWCTRDARRENESGNRAPKVRDPGMKVVSVKIGPYRWILR